MRQVDKIFGSPQTLQSAAMVMLAPDDALITRAAPLARDGVVDPRQPSAVPRAITRMLERAQSLPHRPPGGVNLSSDPSGEVSNTRPHPALTAHEICVRSFPLSNVLHVLFLTVSASASVCFSSQSSSRLARCRPGCGR